MLDRRQRRIRLVALFAVAACGSEGSENRAGSPFREMGAVTEVVIQVGDSAAAPDTITDRHRVDSIVAIMQGGENWVALPPDQCRKLEFVIWLMRDGQLVAAPLISPTCISDASRTLEPHPVRHRVLSPVEAATLHRLLGRN